MLDFIEVRYILNFIMFLGKLFISSMELFLLVVEGKGLIKVLEGEGVIFIIIIKDLRN